MTYVYPKSVRVDDLQKFTRTNADHPVNPRTNLVQVTPKSSGNVPPDKKKTAAPVDAGNGGDDFTKADSFPRNSTTPFQNRTTVNQVAVDALSNVLRHSGPEAWEHLEAALSDLPRVDRVGLSVTLLKTLAPEDAAGICERILSPLGVGMPPVPWLDGIKHEAENWAALATVAERKIYLAAIWDTSPDHIRDGFIKWAGAAA